MEHHKSRGYEPTEFVDGKKSKLVTKKSLFGEEENGMMPLKEKFEVKDEWATEDDGFGGFEEEEKEEVKNGAVEPSRVASLRQYSDGLLGEDLSSVNQTGNVRDLLQPYRRGGCRTLSR